MPRDLMQMLAPLFDQATKMGDIEGSDNLLFPKRFSRKHPRIASMVEGAVLGAALTKPSRTPGEGISNVAQAILGIPEFKKNKQMQKILAPLGMIQQGLEMQKLQSETERNLAGAEYSRGRLQAEAASEDPFDKYFERPEGVYGVTPAGKGQQIPGIPGKPAPTPSAGTEMDREADRRDAERAGRGLPPMSVDERRAFKNEWFQYRAFGGAVGAGAGREVAGDVPEKRATFEKTQRRFAQDEVDIYDVGMSGAMDLVFSKRVKTYKDVAPALERAKALQAEYDEHLNMGGTLTFQEFKDQQQLTGGQNPYDPSATANGNPYRPDQPR